jgi:hypothetical protein
MHGLEAFLVQHVFGALSVTAALAAGSAWIAKELPIFAEKQVSVELVNVLSKIDNPKLKTFCVKLDQLVADAVPEAGDAKYAVLTDLLIKECPAAAPARELLLVVLTGLGAGAKKGLEDAAQDTHQP